MASVFLGTSVYILYRTSSVSIGNAMIELGFIGAIAFCLYLSYRLIVIINGTLS